MSKDGWQKRLQQTPVIYLCDWQACNFLCLISSWNTKGQFCTVILVIAKEISQFSCEKKRETTQNIFLVDVRTELSWEAKNARWHSNLIDRLKFNQSHLRAIKRHFRVFLDLPYADLNSVTKRAKDWVRTETAKCRNSFNEDILTAGYLIFWKSFSTLAGRDKRTHL
jgi:hypothetical protein